MHLRTLLTIGLVVLARGASADPASPPPPSDTATPAVPLEPRPESPAPAATPPAGTASGGAPSSAPPVAASPAATAPPDATEPSPRPPPAPPTRAIVHLGTSHAGTWLEGRSRVDQEEWRRLCAAPCDRALHVDGMELRVTAPSMTSSNTFLVEPGSGVARLRVAGGSSTARTLGIAGLAGGLAVTFAGTALLGYGHLEKDDGFRTAGTVTLATGAVAVLAALPLLMFGSTSVKNHKGKTIAALPVASF